MVAPHYTALLYECGKLDDTKAILVDDVKFDVQQSVHGFLEQVYTHNKDKLLIHTGGCPRRPRSSGSLVPPFLWGKSRPSV
jgi:hypothetical protein